MLIVPIEEVQAGMRLAADMVHPSQPDQILLRRGFLLDGAVISKMRDLGVLAIYVDYPGLADVDRHLAPVMSAERMQIYGQVKSTIAAIQKTARPTVGFADYYGAMRAFVITLFQQGEHPIFLEQIARRLGERGVSHATAVAHLALLLGIRLQSYLLEQRKRLAPGHATEVVNLGIAGMLHDVGKCKLGPEVTGFCATQEPPAEDASLRELWETHPRVGFEMVRCGIEASAAVAILHHHQRFDGQGFPAVTRKGKSAALAGNDIHVFARILQVADLFDRLTHGGDERGECNPRPALFVLHELHTRFAGTIDPFVLGALVQTVPPFPPGSRVRLSDGTEAVVINFSKNPYRPIVRRCTADRRTLQDEALDLSGPDAPMIKTLDGRPVEEYLPEARASEPAGEHSELAVPTEPTARLTNKHPRRGAPATRGDLAKSLAEL